jgi:hypothetical protein
MTGGTSSASRRASRLICRSGPVRRSRACSRSGRRRGRRAAAGDPRRCGTARRLAERERPAPDGLHGGAQDDSSAADDRVARRHRGDASASRLADGAGGALATAGERRPGLASARPNRRPQDTGAHGQVRGSPCATNAYPNAARRKGMQCCEQDEGRPLGVEVQALASNPLTLRGSRVQVVSGEDTARRERVR